MSNDESAFGRPPQWKTALPAISIGVFALCLALYGRYVLPLSLPQQYAAHLQRSAEAYDSIRGVSSMAGGSKLIAVAGDRDVVFERLVSLEKGSPERYWEWFEFLSSHARFLREQLSNPSVSISERYLQPLQGQAELFDAKALDILEQLAVTDSRLKDRAVLRLSKRRYELGFSSSGMFDAMAVMRQLQPVLDAASTPLDAAEREEAEWLLIAVTVEAAWRQTAGSWLRCDPSLIAQASQRLDNALPAGVDDKDIAPRWRALRQLVRIYSDAAATPPTVDDEPGLRYTTGRSDDWRDELAELQLAACHADWQGVEYLLPSPNDSDQERVRNGLARTCCRLVCSAAAQRHAEWAEAQFPAVGLAGRLSPQLPEWSELMWHAARQMSSVATEEATDVQSDVLPANVVQLLKETGDPLMKGTLRGLSASFVDDQEELRLGLEELRPFQGGTHLLSRIALWRAQAVDDAGMQEIQGQLLQLLEGTVEAEPQSGLNWFALGVVQFKLQDFEQAEKSLEKALELSSGAAAVKEALNAVKGARNRIGNREETGRT